ncbi:MAG TPA: ATP-binding protein [Ktedonobacteraceae bacterium]|nr:ATP-binding protein [Ktedonobacteraceae bacterium]
MTGAKNNLEELLYLTGLAHNFPDAVTVMDMSYHILDWNAPAENLFGWKKEEVIGKNAFDIIQATFPYDSRGRAEWQEALAREGRWQSEIIQKRRDGALLNILISLSLVRDRGGTAIGLVAIHRDITERKRAEERARFLSEASKILASTLDYQTILSNVARMVIPELADWCIIHLLDDEGNIRLLEMAHKDPTKVEGAMKLREQSPVMNPDAPLGTAHVMRTGRAELFPEVTDEMLVLLAGDEQRLTFLRSTGYSSLIVVPLKAADHPIGTITFIFAESGRHFNEADLSLAEEIGRRASMAIDHALLYRESQRAREQLMTYITEHKEVERRKDEFMSVVSHELKTPVTTIKGFAQLLQRRLKHYDDSDVQLFLSRMDSQLNRLTRLINDLLEISRIQVGRLKYRVETFDLREVIESAVEQIQATTTTHRISIEDVTGTPALVSGDFERLGHTFTNLLMNAIKYSPHADSVVVRVSVDELEREVIASVQDFGIGIAESDLEKIFERFYQVSYPQERPFSGLGIGLYLSHEIITRHNGRIWVESQKERGSTFYVALPLAA